MAFFFTCDAYISISDMHKLFGGCGNIDLITKDYASPDNKTRAIVKFKNNNEIAVKLAINRYNGEFYNVPYQGLKRMYLSNNLASECSLPFYKKGD